MKALHTASKTIHSNLYDYDIIDQDRERVGSLNSIWNDHQTGEIEFLGIKTAWLFGSNHVVPAAGAEFDEVTRTIQVPFSVDTIKDAPAVDADDEVSTENEAEIARYYGGLGHTGTTYSEAVASSAPTAKTSDLTASRVAKGEDQIEVALSEEQIKVGTRTVDAGTVRLRKVIRTEIVNQPVEVRHEEVVVERVAAADVRTGTATISDFKEEVIDVPLTREEVVIGKEVHVTGAVRLSKTSEGQTQTVSETVRKEDVEVLRDGEIDKTNLN